MGHGSIRGVRLRDIDIKNVHGPTDVYILSLTFLDWYYSKHSQGRNSFNSVRKNGRAESL